MATLKGHEDDNEESSDGIESAKVSATSAAAFKVNLERFKHGGESSGDITTPTKSSTIRRSTRQRPPLDDNEPESSTPPSKRKKKPSSKYAPPSKYAHLAELTDILTPNLITVFIGFNPGITTSTSGHAYAHPSNLFWKLLHSSGCTPTRLQPSQDVDLPRLYSMGNTNIVSRPSKDAGELSKTEMAAGTPILESKIREFRPESVCIVGKGIWEAIWRWRYGRGIRKDEFKYGWQEESEKMGKCKDWDGAWVFVATATSGLAAGMRPHEKEAIWRPFGEWVSRRRKDRGEGGANDAVEEAE